MSSEKDHSSSSPVSNNENRREGDRERSRSRDKNRFRQDRDENRNRDDRKRQKVVRVPELSSELVNFRTFLSYQPDKISKEVAEKEYEIYKQQWEEKANKAFFIEHKNDAWFQEKYNPEVLDAIERERCERVCKNSVDFVNQFKEGFYNDINFTIKDYNQLGFICNERDEEFEELKELTNSNQGIPINFQTVDINVSQKINLNVAPFYGFDPDSYTMFIKAIPRNISKFDIFEIVGKLEGFQSITLSEPIKKLHFSRYCWITFANEQCLKKAEIAMNGLTIKNEPIAFGNSISRSHRVKVLKKYPQSRTGTDADVVKRLSAKLDEECGVPPHILSQTEFSSAQKQLDTFLLYLRRVHAFDYYTSTSYPNERTLCLKLGRVFLRVEADYEEVAGFDTIFKKMQNMAENVIKNGSQIPDHMNKLKEEVEKMVVKLLADSEENATVNPENLKEKTVWICFSCQKKFKSCEFVAKHIIMKHIEIKDKFFHSIMEDAYNLDPNKVSSQPSPNRDERDGNRMRRPGGYRRGRGRDYRDLDDPEVYQAEKSTSKGINFLDI